MLYICHFLLQILFSQGHLQLGFQIIFFKFKELTPIVQRFLKSFIYNCHKVNWSKLHFILYSSNGTKNHLSLTPPTALFWNHSYGFLLPDNEEKTLYRNCNLILEKKFYLHAEGRKKCSVYYMITISCRSMDNKQALLSSRRMFLMVKQNPHLLRLRIR